jgi:glycosyltransferase involved in cell wall biosynthesis
MKILLLNQAFYPDVAATAQHAADLASELSRRGHEVTVIAARRAYDDPSRTFPARELWRGIVIRRVLHFTFGKTSRWRRAADAASLLMAFACRLLMLARCDVVITLTSPPLISVLAALIARVRRSRLIYWVMDLNPDEAIAAGWLRPDSAAAICLEALSRRSLHAADVVIALDRFMKQRIVAKGIPDHKVHIVAPWSHDRVVGYDAGRRLAFRKRHGLSDKFVVMYSGNHSPCHPLDTVLAAARTLAIRPQFAFCLIGGGSKFRDVQQYASQHRLSNILCLPYQSLDDLSASLSAADLQVVIMGDPFLGIVHPCKPYNILSLGMPFLYLGPVPSCVADLAPAEADGRWFFHAQHGDPEALVDCIFKAHKSCVRRSRDELRVAAAFSQDALAPALARIIERTAMPHLSEHSETAFIYSKAIPTR